jgi:hypothetical protein
MTYKEDMNFKTFVIFYLSNSNIYLNEIDKVMFLARVGGSTFDGT